MIENILNSFNEEIDSMLSGHCFQYFMTKTQGDIDLSGDKRNTYHHRFLGRVIQEFHHKFLICLDDKNFNIYKFFSQSKVHLRKQLDRKDKNKIVVGAQASLYGINENDVEPLTPEQREEYEYFFRLADSHYKNYIEYFDELYKDYKNGIIVSDNTAKIETETNDIKTQRLKTNLSVPQLALLFKMLDVLKPKFFDNRTEAELHRFISDNFQTKMSGEAGISTDKLRILFNQPDPKAIDFWEKHLHTLLNELKKFREK
jgi:hypothetical protein